MIFDAAYNPTVLRHQGKLLLVCRHHDRFDWRTSLYLSELSDDLKPFSCSKIEIPKGLEENSNEDARLFVLRGELWISWTCSQYPATIFRCVVAMGRLVFEGGWKVEYYCIPKYANNDFSALEKNWVAFEHDDKLWCYYLTRESEQTFLRLEGEKVVETTKSKSLPWGWGPIHGGAICRAPNGNLWHFFNSRTGGENRDTHRYLVGCAELVGKPPFEMLRISKRPILFGEEGACLDGNKFFKPNVCFCAGAIQNGDQILLAYGWNDSKCRIVKLREADLKL